MDINKDILRWVLLLGAMPIWLPFLKMLWKDFNRALEEEGGVLGRAPTPDEAERIRREKLSDPEILISEPWARPGERTAPRMRAPGSSKNSGSDTGGGRGRAPGASRSGPGGESKSRFRTNPRRGGEGGGGFR